MSVPLRKREPEQVAIQPRLREPHLGKSDGLTRIERSIVITALQLFSRKLQEDLAWNHGGNTALLEDTIGLYHRFQREQSRYMKGKVTV